MADHGVELGRQLLALVSSPQPPAARPRTGSGTGAGLDAAQADFIRALMAPAGGRVPTRPPPGLGVPSGATSARPSPPPGFARADPPTGQPAAAVSRDAATAAAAGPMAPVATPVLEELPSMPAQPPQAVPTNVPYAVVPSGGAGGSVSFIPLQVVPVPPHVTAGSQGDGLQWGQSQGGQGLLQQGAGGALYMPPSWVSSHGAGEAAMQQQQQQQELLQRPEATAPSPHEQLQQQQILQYQQYQQLQHAYAQASAAQQQQQQQNHMMQQFMQQQQSMMQLQHAQAQVSQQQVQLAHAQPLETPTQAAPQHYYYQIQQPQQPPQPQLQYQQQHGPTSQPPQSEYTGLPSGYPQGPSYLQQQALPQQESTLSSPQEQASQAPSPPSVAVPPPLQSTHDAGDAASAGADTSVAGVDSAAAPAEIREATARRLVRIAEAEEHQTRRRHAGQLARRGQAAVQGEEDRLLVWLSQVRVKPKAPISVTIVGPASEFGPEHVGLFRASAPDCRKYLAMRTARVVAGLDGARIANFHAPKGHGLYDVRVFATDDEDCTPIGRSAPFAVEVQGHDLIEAVTYGHSTMLDTMLELKLIGQYAYDEARGASIKEQTQRRDAALRRATGASVLPPTIEEQLTGLMPPSGTSAAWSFFAHRVRSAELEFGEARAAAASGKDAATTPRSLSEAFGSLPAPSAADLTRLTFCVASLRGLVNQARYVPLVFPSPAVGRWTGSASSPAAGAYTEAASSSEFLSANPELCECLWRALRDARFCALLCALFVRASVLGAYPPSPVAQTEPDVTPCVVPPAAFEWAGDASLLSPSASRPVSPAFSERSSFLSAVAALSARADKERSIELAADSASRMRALRALHGEVEAFMQDVLGSSGLRSILLRHRAALVSQWRQSFDPLSESLLPLPYEMRQVAERRPVTGAAGGKSAPDSSHRQGAGSLSSGDVSELVQLVKEAALDLEAAPASSRRRLQAAVALQACGALQAYTDHIAFSQAHSASVASTTKSAPAEAGEAPSTDSASSTTPVALTARALVPPDALPASAIAALSNVLRSRAASLFPSEGFARLREAVRARVAAALAPLQRGSAAGGRAFSVSLFGSSANGFGGDSADVDMALTPCSSAGDEASDVPPTVSAAVERDSDEGPVATAEASPQPGATATATWNPVALMEEAAELLEAAGLASVQVRPTSRIPIVLFVDPESGLQCDICAGNPLAERNTALLRAYSEADPRVRELCFLVKNWAALRRLNDPSSHTLSSYAYVLMALSVLLSRSPHPVVPCLQELAPDWPAGSPSSPDLPLELRVSPEGINYDTYFWQQTSVLMTSDSAATCGAAAASTIENVPSSRTPVTTAPASPLGEYASRNSEPIGRLFLEFLWHYAFEIDTRTTVVAVNRFDDVDAEGEALRLRSRHPFTKSRARIAAFSRWRMSGALSIEDPFEHDYDVAHVLKPQEWRVLRLELGHAYATLVAALMTTPTSASAIDAAVAAVFTALPCAHVTVVPPRRATGMRRVGGSDDDVLAGFEDRDLSLEEAAENAAKAPPPPRATQASRWQRPAPAVARPPLMGGGRRGYEGSGGAGGGFQGRSAEPPYDRRSGPEGWRAGPPPNGGGRFGAERAPPPPSSFRDGGGDDGGAAGGGGGFTFRQRAPPHYPHAFTTTLEDGTHIWSPNGPPPPGHDPHRPWPMASLPAAPAAGAPQPPPPPSDDRLPPPYQQQYARAQFEQQQPMGYGAPSAPPPHMRQQQQQQLPQFYPPPPQGYYPQQQPLYAPQQQQQHPQMYGGGSGGGFIAGGASAHEPWGGGFGSAPPGALAATPYPVAPAPYAGSSPDQQWFASSQAPPPQQQQQQQQPPQQRYDRGW